MTEQLLKEILGELKAMNQRIGSIEKGQTRTEDRLVTLEEGQTRMEDRLVTLEEGQTRMEDRLVTLEEGQTRMEDRLVTLEQKTDRVDSGLLKLETRVESEVIVKISALFDGYSLRGDQIENLRKHLDERLDSIETDTGYLVSRVARLEKAAK